MLDKKYLLPVGAGLLLLLVIGGVLISRMSPKKSPEPATAQTQSAETINAKSFKDLIAAGVAQRCTFSDTTDNVKSEGTVYVGDQKMRGDFKVNTENPIISHMISQNNEIYIWTDNPKMGFKTTFDSARATQAQAEGSTNFDPNKKVDFDCSNWSVDSSMFVLPTGITFTELGKISPATGSGTSNQACAACDALSGEARTSCRTQLKCQ